MVLFEAASRQLERTGLSDVAFELASALSLGQMRLLEVARALATRCSTSPLPLRSASTIQMERGRALPEANCCPQTGEAPPTKHTLTALYCSDSSHVERSAAPGKRLYSGRSCSSTDKFGQKIRHSTASAINPAGVLAERAPH
jgi:hypothetical protein